MKRLRSPDAALLVIFVPLWLLCYGLYINTTARGRLAWVPLVVRASESADGYPTVREFLPGAGVENSGLAVGDQLVRLGATDLRGVGPVGFVARAYEEVGPDLRVPVAFVRAGRQGEASLILTPVASPWLFLLFTFGFVAAGVFSLFYERGSPQTRAFFLASLAFSFHWTLFFGEMRWQTYAWAVVHFLSAVVLLPFILRFVWLFPEKLTLTSFRTPVWFWLFAVLGPLPLSMAFGAPFPPSFGLRANFVVNIVFLVTLIAILTRNFRRANPVGRRQIKWVIYGLYLGLVPVLAVEVIVAIEPSLRWLHEMSMAAPILIPFCICLAILRMNFFDIDRLMSSTIAYSFLLIPLIGSMLFVIPQLAEAASKVVSAEAASWQVAFSVVFALLLMPGERRLRSRIERFFFPARHAIEQGAARLLRELPVDEGPRALLTFLGERLDAVWRPESCVVYERDVQTYAPMFVRGGVAPPAIEERNIILGALASDGTPLDVERFRRVALGSLGEAEQNVLDSLRAAVIVPLSHHTSPTMFLSLGPKRSGDVYTSTDFTLLRAVARAAAEALARQAGKE